MRGQQRQGRGIAVETSGGYVGSRRRRSSAKADRGHLRGLSIISPAPHVDAQLGGAARLRGPDIVGTDCQSRAGVPRPGPSPSSIRCIVNERAASRPDAGSNPRSYSDRVRSRHSLRVGIIGAESIEML